MKLRLRLASFLCIYATSAAGADPLVEKLFAQARSINAGLKDYSAEVSMDLQAKIGPVSLQPKGKATYYYKRDGMHKLEVTSGLRQLKSYPMVFGLNLPNLQNFDSSVLAETTYKGHPVYHCRLLGKPDESAAQIDLLVDKSNFTVPNYVTQYRNGGRLTVEVDYTTVERYLVFQRMRAQADFPSAGTTASGEAVYSQYSFNRNLPDRLFAGISSFFQRFMPA